MLEAPLALASPQLAIEAYEQDPGVQAIHEELVSQGYTPGTTGAAAVVYQVGDEGAVQNYLVSRTYRGGLMSGRLIAAYVWLPGGGPLRPGEGQPKAVVKILKASDLSKAMLPLIGR